MTPKKPGPPTALTVIPVDTAIVASWSPPASNGGSAVTGYEMDVGGQTCSTAGATTCLVNGLTNRKKYTVKVWARNAVGAGKAAKMNREIPSTTQNCSYVGPYANLQGCSGENLQYANLTDANLSDANLSGADLQDSNLTDSNLSGTNLTNADLNSATLTGADVSGANLTNDLASNLFVTQAGGITGTPAALSPGWVVTDGYLLGPGISPGSPNLTDGDLSNVNLTGANLTGANLTGADLTGADLDGNFFAATFYDADFTDANLTNGVFENANLTDANFQDANLTDADLNGATLTGANVAEANLTNATPSNLVVNESGGIIGTPAVLPSGWAVADGYLLGPGINPASPADLSGAELSNVDLSGANLNLDNLSNADLTDANLTGTNFFAADLTDANLTGANLTGADFGGSVSVTGVIWSNTICPDGINSDSAGDTCVNDGA